jgi:hypothetical protein
MAVTTIAKLGKAGGPVALGSFGLSIVEAFRDIGLEKERTKQVLAACAAVCHEAREAAATIDRILVAKSGQYDRLLAILVQMPEPIQVQLAQALAKAFECEAREIEAVCRRPRMSAARLLGE